MATRQFDAAIALAAMQCNTLWYIGHVAGDLFAATCLLFHDITDSCACLTSCQASVDNTICCKCAFEYAGAIATLQLMQYSYNLQAKGTVANISPRHKEDAGKDCTVSALLA